MRRKPRLRQKDAFAGAASVFREHGGVLRTMEAVRHGVHPRTLYAIRDAGLFERLGRGVYPKCPETRSAGLLSDLLSTGGYAGAVAILHRSSETQVMDAGVPPAGDGYYYVSRARTTCGLGSYGRTPTDERVITVCP